MTYDIFLEKEQSKVRAFVIGWPDWVVEGETEEIALQRIRRLIQEQMTRGKIVRIEVPSATEPHPWQRFAGMWREDTTFEQFQAEIQAYRVQMEQEAL
ncbi:MAG TPA: hypothetical protein ENK56_01955 [Chloroflexi bacterium]|nr:hypothetical protein [Chloroflexota bacterium]